MISIIVPVYNKGPYLRRCFDSLLRQTYTDFEVITVDDESSDGSADICKEYMEKYPEFRYFRQKNGGPGVARNHGIKEAKGEWVSFVDGDDYIEPDYLETLLACAEREGAKVAACDSLVEDDDLKPCGCFSNPRTEKTMKPSECWLDLLNGYLYAGVVTMKLIRKEILKDLDFVPIKYGEDSEYVVRLAERAGKITFIPYKGYHYVRVSDSSTMTKEVPPSVIDLDHIMVWSTLSKVKEAFTDNMQSILMDRYGVTVWDAAEKLRTEKDHETYLRRLDYMLEHGKTCLEYGRLEENLTKALKAFTEDPVDFWENGCDADRGPLRVRLGS